MCATLDRTERAWGSDLRSPEPPPPLPLPLPPRRPDRDERPFIEIEPDELPRPPYPRRRGRRSERPARRGPAIGDLVPDAWSSASSSGV
jgi:hypothetical protein